MEAFAKANEIGYPIAADVDGKTVAAFAVDSFPDYYLIDRAGNLRVADLANGDLERAVGVLLSEQVKPASPLAEAAERAQARDKRILVSWGTEEEQAAANKTIRSRDLAQLLRNEYEVVSLARSDAPELAADTGAGEGGSVLSALDAQGNLLARMDAAAPSVEEVRTFLEKHQVPRKDAEQIFRNARERATKEKKRVLVHLGAPW